MHEEFLNRAAECERLAELAGDSISKNDYLRLADWNPRFQTSDGRQHHPPGRVRRENLRIKRERRPHIRLRTQAGRHHSDHEVASAVQTNRLSNDPWIGAKAVAPQCLTQNCHVLSALLPLFS